MDALLVGVRLQLGIVAEDSLHCFEKLRHLNLATASDEGVKHDAEFGLLIEALVAGEPLEEAHRLLLSQHVQVLVADRLQFTLDVLLVAVESSEDARDDIVGADVRVRPTLVRFKEAFDVIHCHSIDPITVEAHKDTLDGLVSDLETVEVLDCLAEFYELQGVVRHVCVLHVALEPLVHTCVALSKTRLKGSKFVVVVSQYFVILAFLRVDNLGKLHEVDIFGSVEQTELSGDLMRLRVVHVELLFALAAEIHSAVSIHTIDVLGMDSAEGIFSCFA
jgi:hypothetical protein